MGMLVYRIIRVPTREVLVRRAGYGEGFVGGRVVDDDGRVLDPGERVLNNDRRILDDGRGGRVHWRQVWRERAVVRRFVGERCEGHVLMACWVVEEGVGRRMVWGCGVCGDGEGGGG